MEHKICNAIIPVSDQPRGAFMAPVVLPLFEAREARHWWIRLPTKLVPLHYHYLEKEGRNWIAASTNLQPVIGVVDQTGRCTVAAQEEMIKRHLYAQATSQPIKVDDCKLYVTYQYTDKAENSRTGTIKFCRLVLVSVDIILPLRAELNQHD